MGQDGNPLYGFRQLSEKVGPAKKGEMMHAEQPDLLSAAFSVSTTLPERVSRPTMAIITRSASAAPV